MNREIFQLYFVNMPGVYFCFRLFEKLCTMPGETSAKG